MFFALLTMPAVINSNVDDPTAPEKNKNVSANKGAVREDFSIFTAASESELCNSLRSYAYQFQSDTGFGVRSSPNQARQPATLKYWLRRVELCVITGTSVLGLLFVIDLLYGAISSAVAFFLFMLAVGLSGVWGYRQVDWRPLVAFFIFSFILLAYTAARAILILVMLVAQPWAIPNETTNQSDGSANQFPVAIAIVTILFNVVFSVFWGYTVFATEKTIRIMLELSDTSPAFPPFASRRQVFCASPPTVTIEGTVVGHPTSDTTLPTPATYHEKNAAKSATSTKGGLHGRPTPHQGPPFTAATIFNPPAHDACSRTSSAETCPTEHANSVEDIPLSPYTSARPER